MLLIELIEYYVWQVGMSILRFSWASRRYTYPEAMTHGNNSHINLQKYTDEVNIIIFEGTN